MTYIRRTIRSLFVAVFLSFVAFSWGCSQATPTAMATGQATIQGTSEASNVTGIVTFQDTANGLEIIADITNAPAGTHGFHIHEFGSCADTGNAAGGHYNPDNVQHGNILTDGFDNAHAGDLGNIEVAEGAATYSATVPGLSLTSGSYPVAGRAVIVHENPDDFGQPTGNAGGRIGCGTIVLVAPPTSSEAPESSGS